MINVTQALFEDYNRIIAENHENIINNLLKDLPPNEIEKRYDDIYQEAIFSATSWDNDKNPILDNRTPNSFFTEINDFDDCMLLYKTAARTIDDVFPASFIQLLDRFRDYLIPVFIEYATDSTRFANEESRYEVSTAIRLLGEWQVTGAISPIIDALLQSKDTDELYCEELWEALYLIGIPSIKKITEALNSADIITFGHEYLLIALTELGKNFPSDGIYTCIKNTFLKMDNKIYGIICLGQYGNPRAIPFLRGYYQKNSDSLSDEVLFEIKSSIQKLGGQTGDLL